MGLDRRLWSLSKISLILNEFNAALDIKIYLDLFPYTLLGLLRAPLFPGTWSGSSCHAVRVGPSRLEK